MAPLGVLHEKQGGGSEVLMFRHERDACPQQCFQISIGLSEFIFVQQAYVSVSIFMRIRSSMDEYPRR